MLLNNLKIYKRINIQTLLMHIKINMNNIMVIALIFVEIYK